MTADPLRPAWVEVDVEAIAANVDHLRRLSAPALLWAVVKADGYGHGAVRAARAALAGGAEGLAVALVGEGEELRAAEIECPILVLSEPPAEAMGRAVMARLEPAVSSLPGIDAAAAAAVTAGDRRFTVHLKIDTGMHRSGCAPADAPALATAITRRSGLRLGSVWTHCAVADDPDDPFTAIQLDRLDAVLEELSAVGVEPPRTHAANSAGAMWHPRARRSMVRCGIAIYGLAPSLARRDQCGELRAALRLVARVSSVRRIGPGEGVSYGLRYRSLSATTIATVPLGYADGVPRRLFETGGQVLIGGSRRPLAGVVTMDQLMVDCGNDPVESGDEVVLIGRQGSETITVEEWAERLGTITYEITCALGARLPRREF